MAVNIIGNLYSYDPEKQTVTFRLAFINSSIEEEIMNLMQKSSLHKFSFSSVKESGTYGQQKRLFGTLGAILDKLLKRKHTAKEMSIFYMAIVKQFFPVRTYLLGDDLIRAPVVSLADLSKEERDDLVETIQEFYAYLNIDFAELGY